jgi:hypothetical protein
MPKRKLTVDDENQTKCWIATEGHQWMRGFFDTLPATVRVGCAMGHSISVRRAW